ncbi:MAG: hexameric tyrosine-coordinated heme protein [Acidimicrobiales bacterium]
MDDSAQTRDSMPRLDRTSYGCDRADLTRAGWIVAIEFPDSAVGNNYWRSSASILFGCMSL